MQAVKSEDTSAEMKVRRLLHSAGFRYRLHDKNLPGSPDMVFASRRKVIFIHGCFWHGHECQRGARVPKTNTDYWLAKIDRNRQRDLRAAEQLTEAGWGVLIVWECEIKSLDLAKLSSFLQ
jgi:DNA mismatch endonuclease (patch repair protein)